MTAHTGISDSDRAFLMAEYESLKADYGRFVESSLDLLKYAAVTSGAIFAWMATNGDTGSSSEPPVPLNPWLAALAWLSAPAISAALGSIVFSLWHRARARIDYLAMIEEKLLSSGSNLGFECYLKRKSGDAKFGPGNWQWATWVGLFIADLVFALTAISHLKWDT